jgi:hypothetical protein
MTAQRNNATTAVSNAEQARSFIVIIRFEEASMLADLRAAGILARRAGTKIDGRQAYTIDDREGFYTAAGLLRIWMNI